MQNIVAAIFEKESEGYQALTELRQAPVTDKAAIMQMALVKRTDKGFVLCDGYDAGVLTDSGAVVGGLLGGLVGILGGPLGVLLLGSYGALAGGMVGAADTLDVATLIEKVAGKMVEGEIALIALADEKDEAEIDARLGKFDVTIVRFDAAAVADEVEEAQKLQAEADRQALAELRKAKKGDRKARIEAKRAEIDANYEALYAMKGKDPAALL